MSMLTREASEGYGAPMPSVPIERVREIMAHALFLRQHLDLDLDRSTCGDAWVLAEHYRDRFNVVARPGWPPCIAFRAGCKDLIILNSDMGPWEEAHVLAHEIGHSLFTRPGSGLTIRQKEMLAEAFAVAFLLWPLGKLDSDGACCRLES